MTISQIKAQLKIESLDLARTLDEKQQPTQWLRYWNDDSRIAVVLHDDVLNIIKANMSINTLALKHEVKKTKAGKAAGTIYDSYIIINAKSIEAVL